MANTVIKFPSEALRVAKAAEFYAQINGWRIVPLHYVIKVEEEGEQPTFVCSCDKGAECLTPGKHPCINNYAQAATTDVEIIRGWWKKWPKANVGIYIDARDKNNIAVVDVDIKPDQGKD